MIRTSFKSENLKVDYLSFNFQFNNFKQIEIIANLLADTFRCKSTLVDQLSKKRHQLTEINKSRYSAEFTVNLNMYWRGTTLSFKGKHAQLFYDDLKFQKLDWFIFDLRSTNLGRIDLCYDRKLKANDKDLHLFFEDSYKQVNSKKNNPTAKIGNNILRVGKQSSSNFFRVYLKSNGKELRFEIELKKIVLKNFQHYLFTNQFEVFEKLLVRHFYNQATRFLNIENSYCDWLLANFRHVEKPMVQGMLANSLSTSYLTNKSVKSLDEIKFFYRLIQLLNYIKSLKSSSERISMGDKNYKIFKFPVNQFLEFTGQPKNNYYQIKKLVEFLKSLQKIEPIVDNFSDGGFRSYVIFPYIKVERKKGWWVELSICQELCSYQYPFHLPETFLNYQDNFELKVKFVLLKSFCNVSIYKEFPTQEFLEQVTISTSKSAKIKKYIVAVLSELKDHKLIKSKFQVLTKQNKLKEVDKLTSNLVSRSKSIFYMENIHSRSNFSISN